MVLSSSIFLWSWQLWHFRTASGNLEWICFQTMLSIHPLKIRMTTHLKKTWPCCATSSNPQTSSNLPPQWHYRENIYGKWKQVLATHHQDWASPQVPSLLKDPDSSIASARWRKKVSKGIEEVQCPVPDTSSLLSFQMGIFEAICHYSNGLHNDGFATGAKAHGTGPLFYQLVPHPLRSMSAAGTNWYGR